jgi:hypothetical protein
MLFNYLFLNLILSFFSYLRYIFLKGAPKPITTITSANSSFEMLANYNSSQPTKVSKGTLLAFTYFPPTANTLVDYRSGGCKMVPSQ